MLRQQVKKIYIVLYKYMFSFYYAVISNLKKHDNMKAVFVLSREQKLQGNLHYVYHELVKQQPNIKIHFVYAENRMNLKLFMELNVISNAQYIILDDYYLPIYLIKPKEQLKVIQLWHAAGAFKKFGYSTLGTRFGPSKDYLKLVPIHSSYTHVYVSSENAVPYYAEAFNMSLTNIFAMGIPRIDIFNDVKLKEEIKEKVYEIYPSVKNKSNINVLIAPTYRATGNQEESTFNIINILTKINSVLKQEVNILFKPHPYTSMSDLEQLKSCSKVTIIDKFSLNDWMLVSDAFITDYSSAIFDFSLLHKPFAHYVPDLTQYEKNRGFYEDIEQISDGMIIKKESELINWINDRNKGEGFDTTRMINYNFSQTQQVTEKIVKHFI